MNSDSLANFRFIFLDQNSGLGFLKPDGSSENKYCLLSEIFQIETENETSKN